MEQKIADLTRRGVTLSRFIDHELEMKGFDLTVTREARTGFMHNPIEPVEVSAAFLAEMSALVAALSCELSKAHATRISLENYAIRQSDENR